MASEKKSAAEASTIGRARVESMNANMSAIGTAEAGTMRTSLSAIGTADVGDLHTTGTAVGVANVTGDVDLTTSAAGLVSADGSASIHQAVAWGVFSGGDVKVSQAASVLTVAQGYRVDSGAAAAVVAGEATIKHGWIGFLFAPKATISEDSKVLLSTKAALIIAAALFGGFALVAVVMALGVRRVMSWRPQSNVPTIPQMPDFGRMAQQFRHHNAA